MLLFYTSVQHLLFIYIEKYINVNEITIVYLIIKRGRFSLIEDDKEKKKGERKNVFSKLF